MNTFKHVKKLATLFKGLSGNAFWFGIGLVFIFGCGSKKLHISLSEEKQQLQDEINRISDKIESDSATFSELFDYFEESVNIIQRSLNNLPENPEGDLANYKRGIKDARFLTDFLNEEILNTEKNTQEIWLEIDVLKEGLVNDGKADNRILFDQLINRFKVANQPVKLIFPAGDYYFSKEKHGNAITLSNLSDVVFQGKGQVRFICDGSYGGLHNIFIEDCTNLEFRNIVVDNSPFTYTLGNIESVLSGNEIIIHIMEPYPAPDTSYYGAMYLRGLVHNPSNGRIDKSCGDPRVIRMEPIGDEMYRLTLDNNQLDNSKEMTANIHPGQWFSLHPRQREINGNGLTVHTSSHLLFSNFYINSCDGHAFNVCTSSGVKFINCAAQPAEGRVMVNNADGFHCISNRKGVYLERCHIFATNDDCINFYTKMASIIDAKDGDQFILSTTEENLSKLFFNPGDEIGFVDPDNGAYSGFATIDKIDTVNWQGNRRMLRIKTKDHFPMIRSREGTGRPLEIKEREYTPSGGDNYRAAMAINAPFEHMIANFTAKNDGFIIRNSSFGYNRSEGFKCKASNGIIRNTRFIDRKVHFLCSPAWLEGVYPTNIEVTDVVLDIGITFTSNLPREILSGQEVEKFMTDITFDNVRDSLGNILTPPGE